MRKMKRNPYQVCQLDIAERNANDEIKLKQWLRGIDFFFPYPELIMDRVCEKLVPVEYIKDQIIMGKGDKSEFMIVIYSGEIGIYLQTVIELEASGTENKCIAKKLPESVLGEAGLLKEASRGATCIANTEVKALYLSAPNYVQIVESFHKSELYKHIEFNKSLDFLKEINYIKTRRLAESYNSSVFKRGQIIIDTGAMVSQLYILKTGKLKVEK
jgi:cGMP-dependent protein kinase 1